MSLLRQLAQAAVVAACALLTACGDSSDSGNDTSQNPSVKCNHAYARAWFRVYAKVVKRGLCPRFRKCLVICAQSSR